MWDDKINRRIKEAAEQYHPAYNEDAWKKMEQMLDKNLPQKKDGRRIIYFLLVAILLGTGAYLVFYTNIRKEKFQSASSLSAKIKEESYKEHRNLQESKKVVTAIQKNVVVKPSTVNKQNNQNFIQGDAPGESVKISAENHSREISFLENQIVSTGRDQTKIFLQENKHYLENIELASEDTLETSINTNLNGGNKSFIVKNAGSKSSQKDVLQRLRISFSAGPDISGVDLEEVGKTTLSYGAGLRYLLSNKISLRTGFYVAKKIYSADKKYYKPSGFTSADYYYLQTVDANCNVYEIPITLSYNFRNQKNHSWFASAGLSSYLMKKESYIYYYKYPSGNTEDQSWSVSNRNKHYFSVLDISAGYEYRVNKKLTLGTEPYLKLPLAGIGDGKIKLKSGGILFSVILKP